MKAESSEKTTTPSSTDDNITSNENNDVSFIDPEYDSAAPTVTEAGSTRYGKKIEIRRTGNGRMFVIDMKGGGRQPPELSGHYTRFTAAQQAIEAYEAKAAPNRNK